MDRPETARKQWSKTHRMHAEPRTDDGTAFLRDPGSGPARAPDDLAELVAEEYVASALAGEEVAFDDRDVTAPEEYGGPFIEERIPEELLALDEQLRAAAK